GRHRSPPPFPTRRSSDLYSPRPHAAQGPGVRPLGRTHVGRTHVGGAARPDPRVVARRVGGRLRGPRARGGGVLWLGAAPPSLTPDRKSTRLNSSHVKISY